MEQIVIKGETKEEIYSELLPQIKSLIADEPDLIANLANVTSALKQAFPSFSWVGFYLMKGNELVLAQEHIEHILREISKNKTVLVVSHDVGFVLRNAKRILCLGMPLCRVVKPQELEVFIKELYNLH